MIHYTDQTAALFERQGGDFSLFVVAGTRVKVSHKQVALAVVCGLWLAQEGVSEG